VQYFPFTESTKEISQKLTKGATQLPESLKEGTILQNKTAETIQNAIVKELQLNWIKGLALIVFGIIVGCLLILHKTIGYLLAIIMSLGLIFSNSFSLYQMIMKGFSLEHYALLFEHYPLGVIRDVVMLVVLLVTVIVLISIYVGEKLKRNEPR
jgi:hypothetical protein